MSEKREIIVVVRGSEECRCMIDGETLCDYDEGDGYDDGGYLTECPHGSVARAATAADHAEALGLSVVQLFQAGGMHKQQADYLLHEGDRGEAKAYEEDADDFEKAARRVREAQEKRGAQ